MRNIKGVLTSFCIMFILCLVFFMGGTTLVSFALWTAPSFWLYFTGFRLSVVFAVILTAGFMLSKESK